MNAPLTGAQTAHTLAVEFAARAPQHDREASFPFENFRDLHQAGLLALAAPQVLGGQGASIEALGDVIGAIGQARVDALALRQQAKQLREQAKREIEAALLG